jgi:hypothetical protein
MRPNRWGSLNRVRHRRDHERVASVHVFEAAHLRATFPIKHLPLNILLLRQLDVDDVFCSHRGFGHRHIAIECCNELSSYRVSKQITACVFGTVEQHPHTLLSTLVISSAARKTPSSAPAAVPCEPCAAISSESIPACLATSRWPKPRCLRRIVCAPMSDQS